MILAEEFYPSRWWLRFAQDAREAYSVRPDATYVEVHASMCDRLGFQPMSLPELHEALRHLAIIEAWRLPMDYGYRLTVPKLRLLARTQFSDRREAVAWIQHVGKLSNASAPHYRIPSPDPPPLRSRNRIVRSTGWKPTKPKVKKKKRGRTSPSK